MDNETLKSFVFEGGAKDREQGLSLKEDCRQGWQRGFYSLPEDMRKDYIGRNLKVIFPTSKYQLPGPKPPIV